MNSLFVNRITIDKAVAAMTFTEWLDQELGNRGWTRAQLARRMKTAEGVLSRIYSGERNPGVDVCNKIAKALGIPPEVVFRQAGLLPPLPGPEDDQLLSQITDAYKRLPPEKRRSILSFVLWTVREESQAQSPDEPGIEDTDGNRDS